ncbi:hypothetical protein GCM10027040_10270 [Halomonas shantousis]
MADPENRVTPGTPSYTGEPKRSSDERVEKSARTVEASAQAKQQAGQVKERAKAYAHHQSHEARRQATGIVEQQVERQKEMAADQVGGVAKAVHSMADQFDEQGQASWARYAHDLAGNVDEFSGTLRERDAATLISQTKALGRRRPALFVGGAVMAGILLSRFVKSSRTSG